jgi:hypothetical protein
MKNATALDLHRLNMMASHRAVLRCLFLFAILHRTVASTITLK